MHPEQPPEALFLALGRVVDCVALADVAGVDAEVGEPSDVGVADDLERKGAERLVVVRQPLERFAGFRVGAGNGRHFVGSRQVSDNGIEQRPYALIAQRGAAEDGRGQAGDRRAAERLLQLCGGHFVALHVADHQLVVDLGCALDQAIAVLGGFVG